MQDVLGEKAELIFRMMELQCGGFTSALKSLMGINGIKQDERRSMKLLSFMKMIIQTLRKCGQTL